jgi:alpha-1,6-mannosyltransferase
LHGCPFETFGLGVAEAVAAGCPIVVPDEGGAAELAFGESGVRYEARDVEACAEAAIALLGRDPAGLRDAAKSARENVWSEKDQFSRTIELYEELLAERR